ncbi:MAG: replication-associated recombination protein A [Deltaproteobacteria bacterium]|nr:replication-associated recombination protein A [Deltaproteobacteria bacterium]
MKPPGPPTLDLFAREPSTEPTAQDPSTPLAQRMRPRTLDELVGQDAVLGPGTPLGRALREDRAPSLVLWGPPGCGKTTVARALAAHSRARFVALSAVLSGVQELRAVLSQAEHERALGRRTVLFIDEIHRFNRAQQDALLPHVEAGAVTLVGATTENPSFAVNAAVLSRVQVLRLEALSTEALGALVDRCLGDTERGLGGWGLALDPEARDALCRWADGDARRALGLLEHVCREAREGGRREVTVGDVEAAARSPTLRYDKAGEEHYNVASAFIKSLRGSDPDAALYWALRMIEAGDDPRFVLRRMMIFASEDIGLADTRALEVSVAADRAFERLGVPEGLIPLSHAVVYLALAPKSKASYHALRAVQEEITRTGALPVPLRLRNAPTAAMKQWGYGRDYKDPQATDEGFVPERYLPEALGTAEYYHPTARGHEGRVAEHLAKLRARARTAPGV